MPRRIPTEIPDYDGRPHPGLDAALREIDRRYLTHPQRRFLRAACCYEHGDAMGWHREMTVGLAEFADERNLPRSEIRRLIVPANVRAVEDAMQRFRDAG